MKIETLILKIEPEVKQKLKIEASRRGMSVASLVRMMVSDYFKKGEL